MTKFGKNKTFFFLFILSIEVIIHSSIFLSCFDGPFETISFGLDEMVLTISNVWNRWNGIKMDEMIKIDEMV